MWNKELGYCGSRSRIPSLRVPYCCKTPHGVSSKIEPLVSRSKGERKTHYGKGGSDGLRKRFSLRLRPRLRLLAIVVRVVLQHPWQLNSFALYHGLKIAWEKCVRCLSLIRSIVIS